MIEQRLEFTHQELSYSPPMVSHLSNPSQSNFSLLLSPDHSNLKPNKKRLRERSSATHRRHRPIIKLFFLDLIPIDRGRKSGEDHLDIICLGPGFADDDTAAHGGAFGFGRGRLGFGHCGV